MRSNFKFPLLEMETVNNDLEIWISTFPREEVAKRHALFLLANLIREELNLQESWEGLVKDTDSE